MISSFDKAKFSRKTSIKYHKKKLIKKKGILPELVASQPQIGHDMKSTRAFHEGHKMHPVLSNYFNRHALQNQEHKSKAKVESAVHVL